MRRFILRLPFAQQLYQHYQELKYERLFAGDCYGCFRGVYETFEEAIRSAPKTKSIGYDNSELAQDYQQDVELETTVQSYDYPVLLWLNSIFTINPINLSIFDFGGNVGIHFYSYEKYIKYPANLRWIVCDVPAIVQAGKELAERRHRSELIFTGKFEEASGKDVFLASGSIQYVENLSLSISSLPEKPKHLLINRLPLYDGFQFVTLQNGGNVFYPSYIFNKTNFLDSLNKIGYEMVDIWEDRVDGCFIPFHPDKSCPFYYGLYFKLRS
ncbi:MAG TPA: methyltransferase, TIGR04325 family [Coleofasciculaceae cyanobacterium]|jgi:putative methyltransferase (TIGR04325 family)